MQLIGTAAKVRPDLYDSGLSWHRDWRSARGSLLGELRLHYCCQLKRVFALVKDRHPPSGG